MIAWIHMTPGAFFFAAGVGFLFGLIVGAAK